MNLLPQTEKDYIKQGLKSRFLVIGLSLLSVSFLVGVIMLFPSYFLVRVHFSEIKKEPVKTDESINEILNLPKEIDSKLDVFESSNSSLSVAEALSYVVGQTEGGVVVEAISFLRNEKSGDISGIRVLISGTASTRESLLNFGNNLKDSKKFLSVDIPVSSFTKDRNLPFSIALFIQN